MATSEAEFPLSASNIICRPWVSTGMSTLACFQPVPELVNFRSVASSRLQAFRENNNFSTLLHTNSKEKPREKNIVLFAQTKMGIIEKKYSLFVFPFETWKIYLDKKIKARTFVFTFKIAPDALST